MSERVRIRRRSKKEQRAFEDGMLYAARNKFDVKSILDSICLIYGDDDPRLHTEPTDPGEETE